MANTEEGELLLMIDPLNAYANDYNLETRHETDDSFFGVHGAFNQRNF